MGVTLTELQRIPTSGARAVEAVAVDGLELLAIPQLARDIPGQPAAMNGGDSDTDLLVLRRAGGRYVLHSTLAAPGGEDAEFFTIGADHFLAVASIRTGSGPYRYVTNSRIHRWRDGLFQPFQDIETFAAKQWKHWTIGARHFLGLAQGVQLPNLDEPNRDSIIFEWDGSAFAEFQRIPSQWAYNWHPFQIGGTSFLAHADHLGPSVLYRWDGARYVVHQELMPRAGRCFASFERAGAHYLVVGSIHEPVRVLRREHDYFETVQELPGLGARELRVVSVGGRLLVVRVNFILGSPADPRPALNSCVYEWRDGALGVAAEFPTSGGTDVELVANGEEIQLVVANSLTPAVRFANHTTVYALTVTDENGATDRGDGVRVMGSTA
jgi:hypothetical protein